MGGEGQRTIAAASGRMASAATAYARERRTVQQQNAKQAAASSAWVSVGPGTRKSAACERESREMARVIPWSSSAVAAPGIAASHELMRAQQKVAMPSGASTTTSGMLTILAGSAKTVARWK